MIIDDSGLQLTVKPCAFIQKDIYGYYIDVYITKSSVAKVMCEDIIPTHTDNNRFTIRIRLNNNTIVKLNKIRIYNFSDKRLQALPTNKLKIDMLMVKKYAKNSRHILSGYCYATHLIFKIELPKVKG